jgi:hypothetical protein
MEARHFQANAAALSTEAIKQVGATTPLSRVLG